MSFVTTLSPHILIFVALFLMHDGVDGTELNPREGAAHGSPGPPSPPSPPSTSPIHIPPTTSSPVPSHTSSTSPSNTPSRASSQISNISTSISSLSSSLPPSTSNSDRLANSRRIGTIVGAVLGSVILVSLGLMTLAYYRRRVRRARNRPIGSVCFNEPQLEMIQTPNGPPLTSSAPLVHRPVPIHFFNTLSENNTASSLTPLIPTDNLNDTTRHRLLSTSADGDLDVPSAPLRYPYGTQPTLSPGILRLESTVDSQPNILRLESAVTAGSASSSTSGQLSPLHREMEGFQKALEADHKREISDRSDPPPIYTHI